MANITFQQWKEASIRKARAKKIPITGHFELTGRCNLDCKICYVHTLDHSMAKEKELSTVQWKQIFDDAEAKGMLFATLSGGECLLRPDFKELYLHLWEKRIFVAVLTNGTMLDADYVAFFQQYRPEFIQISLYGTSEEGYLEVTGHKGFEKTVSAIRALKAAGIDVRVAITPSRYLHEDYIPTIQFCRDNGFRTALSEMVLVDNRENPEKDDYNLTMEEILALSVRRTELQKPVEPLDNTPEPGGRETVPPKGFVCNAGNCLATVTWDGKMYPCVSATQGPGADVRALGFAKAWEQTKAAAQEVLLPMECVGCPYDAICVRCPISRSKGMDGHCDPAICEMTRRLVAAGVKKLPKEENNTD